jgi:hypothetical protein
MRGFIAGNIVLYILASNSSNRQTTPTCSVMSTTLFSSFQVCVRCVFLQMMRFFKRKESLP